VIKHDKNSGMNYITAMDSKPVSIVSIVAGVTPMLNSRRYISEAKSKIDIPFPQVFHLYNRYTGGVDLYDGHCNNVIPSIRSKKWTWIVFIRLIQAAIVHSVVIFNACGDDKSKIGTKEFVMLIAKSYKNQMKRSDHRTSRQSKQKCCSKCSVRTYLLCEGCNLLWTMHEKRTLINEETVRGKGTHYNLAPRKRQKFYHVHVVVSGLR